MPDTANARTEDKRQFVDAVLTPFGARFSSSEPFRPIAVRSVHADDDDGKVVDGTAFYDSISFNDLWTRVQP